MDSKLIGSILLIVGTTIGAGMLALPIATAQLGFLGSLVFLFICWFVMTAGAFLLLEANLWLPQQSHIISMAKATLGRGGQIVAWVTYLLLLYSLLCAYIAGGSDLFHSLLSAQGLTIPAWLSALLFTLIFSSVVYLGIRSIDYVNRGLMFVKLGAYILLVLLLLPFVSTEHLMAGKIGVVGQATAIMVTITSFGYAAIIPSLRVYFAGDVQKLRKAILIGSIVPLICYIAWDLVIMGIIPLEGSNGLIAVLNSPNSTSDLVGTLNATVSYPIVHIFTKLFTSICVLTSFLGVSLCLVDFLADGLTLEKKGGSGWLLHALVFLPPLIVVLFWPSIFVKALQYAGLYCVILLILLPALMVWSGRYWKKIAKGYSVPGGRFLLAILILASLALIGQNLS